MFCIKERCSDLPLELCFPSISRLGERIVFPLADSPSIQHAPNYAKTPVTKGQFIVLRRIYGLAYAVALHSCPLLLFAGILLHLCLCRSANRSAKTHYVEFLRHCVVMLRHLIYIEYIIVRT